jgi:hypothetical protein
VALAQHDDVIEALAARRTDDDCRVGGRAHTAEERSQVAFRSGVRTAVLMTRVPTALAARSKSLPNLSSRSRIRNRGPSPNGVRSSAPSIAEWEPALPQRGRLRECRD